MSDVESPGVGVVCKGCGKAALVGKTGMCSLCDPPEPRPLNEDAEESASGAVEGAPQPVFTDIDEAEEAAQKEREAQFGAEPTWKGRPLLLTVAREAHFEEFRTAIGAPPWSQVSYDSWTADALRLLYLCSEEPRMYRHLRGDPAALQEAIDDWTAENVPRAEIEKAKEVAFDLWKARNDNRPEEMQPERRPNSDDAGGN